LLSFNYKKKATNTQCFQRFDFDSKEVIMQPAKAQVELKPFVSKASAKSAKREHVFTVGTRMIAVPHEGCTHLEDLRVQGLHTDGPRKYSPQQFDENGNLRADAPATADADTAIPFDLLHGPDASTSVLLAFFTNTLLGIPPKSRQGRHHSQATVSKAESVPLGTGVAFLFDTFHQV